MRGRAGRRLGGWGLLAVTSLAAHPLSRLSAQQVASNRATAYLHPTDVRDARALWVNPAGLAVLREASVYAELAVSDPGAKGRLRQIDAGFNARGLSLGYQRDILDDGARGHTYRIGLAGSAAGLAAGFAVAHYRGDGPSATGWDIGASYSWMRGLTVGGVIANLGQPVVRGLRQPLTYVPGFTWYPAPVPSLGFSSHARITADSVAAYAFGVSWQQSQSRGRWPLGLIVRLDTDGGLRRGAFSLGLSLGNQDRLGAVASAPGDASRVDAVSVYGVASREPVRGRR